MECNEQDHWRWLHTILYSVYLVTALTDHLTSFAVFFDIQLGQASDCREGECVFDRCTKYKVWCSDEQRLFARWNKAYWMAAIGLIGAMILFSVAFAVAAIYVPLVRRIVYGYRYNATSIFSFPPFLSFCYFPVLLINLQCSFHKTRHIWCREAHP